MLLNQEQAGTPCTWYTWYLIYRVPGLLQTREQQRYSNFRYLMSKKLDSMQCGTKSKLLLVLNRMRQRPNPIVPPRDMKNTIRVSFDREVRWKEAWGETWAYIWKPVRNCKPDKFQTFHWEKWKFKETKRMVKESERIARRRHITWFVKDLSTGMQVSKCRAYPGITRLDPALQVARPGDHQLVTPCWCGISKPEAVQGCSFRIPLKLEADQLCARANKTGNNTSHSFVLLATLLSLCAMLWWETRRKIVDKSVEFRHRLQEESPI